MVADSEEEGDEEVEEDEVTRMIDWMENGRRSSISLTSFLSTFRPKQVIGK